MNTHGFQNIAEMHGPNFLNRCAMQFVIQKYNVSHPRELSPTAVSLGMMKKEQLVLNGNPGFFRECHTNGGCKRPKFDQTFVNVQVRVFFVVLHISHSLFYCARIRLESF